MFNDPSSIGPNRNTDFKKLKEKNKNKNHSSYQDLSNQKRNLKTRQTINGNRQIFMKNTIELFTNN